MTAAVEIYTPQVMEVIELCKTEGSGCIYKTYDMKLTVARCQVYTTSIYMFPKLYIYI